MAGELIDPVYDGYLSFVGGQNDGSLVGRIKPDQVRRAVNLTFKDGDAQPRPAFEHVELRFESTKILGRTIEDIFSTGKFQMFEVYLDSGNYVFICVICGMIFRIEEQTGWVDILKIGNGEDRLNQYKRRYLGTTAGRFFVIFDYPNSPIIIEGVTARRANPNRTKKTVNGIVPFPEVPPAVDGIFVGNRLWVRNQIHEYTAGDPVGGISEDAPITFEEVLVQAQSFYKQAFSLGFRNSANPITAFAVLQAVDSSTGIGPLVIATADDVYAARSDLERAKWDIQNFSQVILINNGIIGPRAVTNRNSDLFFIASDVGVRTLSMSRNEQGRWSNSPISKEVEKLLKFGDSDLDEVCFADQFQNRLLFGAIPFHVEARTLENAPIFDSAHYGFLVLELDNVSGLGTNADPSWAGLWTGIRPMASARVRKNFYVMSKDLGSVNRLYRINPDGECDKLKDFEVDIPTRLYTRDFDFSRPATLKEEGDIVYNVSNISGRFEMEVSRKRSVDQAFVKWGSTSYEVKNQNCVAGGTLKTLEPHGMQNLSLGDPEKQECDVVTEDRKSLFNKTSLLIEMRARTFKLESMSLKADPTSGANPRTAPCKDLVVEVERKCDRADDLDFYLLSRDYNG